MSQMLDLIRESKVPANLMRAAARGSLSASSAEIIEILVYLALHHKGLGSEARITLAGWDERACVAAASNPATSPDVLQYFASLENLRIPLLPALAENTSVSEVALGDLASRGARPMIEALLPSHRVSNSQALLTALLANPNLRPAEAAEIEAKLAAISGVSISGAAAESEAGEHTAIIEATVAGFLKDNAAEVEAEKDKKFHPIGEMHESIPETSMSFAAAAGAANAPSTAPTSPAPTNVGLVEHKSTGTAAAAAHARLVATGQTDRRDSALQKIAKLDIKGRISLAIRGSKEDRSILIRDGTKIVALAVLESPKLTDGEVENFAQQKNVLEAVLRQIPLKRRFAKNYNVNRNLVFNPRSPIDLSLTLMKVLLAHDLKNLSGNKQVSETIRKMALRMFRQKTEKK